MLQQQPKPGEPLYAQVNLEKKKKRQYELGVGQAGAGGGASGGQGVVGGGATGPGAGSQSWLDADGQAGAQDTQASTLNLQPSSAAVAAGDSWV